MIPKNSEPENLLCREKQIKARILSKGGRLIVMFNARLVALLNRGGVTRNTRPVAMHNTVFGPEFRPCRATSSEITIYSILSALSC